MFAQVWNFSTIVSLLDNNRGRAPLFPPLRYTSDETKEIHSASEARFLPRDHQVGSTKASLTFSYPRVFVLPRMQRGTEVVSKCDLYNIEKSSKSSI